MTYTIRVRGAVNQPKVLEFECPVHGRFEATVPSGTAEVPCPISLYEDGDCCHDCAGFCELPSPWAISAPKPRNLTVLPTAVVKGGDTDRRPGMLDTRPLAEGQSYSEWKKVQGKGREERRHQMLVSKGIKQKRIQVG